MKKSLDVWIIVPCNTLYPAYALDGRHFTSKAKAERYRYEMSAQLVDPHVICKATLTMVTDDA